MRRVSILCIPGPAGIKLASLLILLVLTGASILNAQQPTAPPADRELGIKLIEQGDFKQAVKALRSVTKKNKNDIAAWHWLGVAYERLAKNGDARKAHEKAAKLGDALLLREMDLGSWEDFNQAVKARVPEITLAARSAAAYINLSPKLSQSKSAKWSERSEFLQDYMTLSLPGGLAIYKSKDVTTRARVLAKPEPQYTQEAREHQISGTVVLRAVFAEDGKVRGIMVVSRLPYGLTSQAIRAARLIKFVPAMKDGRPVSMWMQLEYNFNIY